MAPMAVVIILREMNAGRAEDVDLGGPGNFREFHHIASGITGHGVHHRAATVGPCDRPEGNDGMRSDLRPPKRLSVRRDGREVLRSTSG